MSEKESAGLLERELRVALGRVNPPEGFAGRVMARAAEQRGARAGVNMTVLPSGDVTLEAGPL